MDRRFKIVRITIGCIVILITVLLLVKMTNGKKVMVVPVSDLMFYGEMEDNLELQGTITTDVAQRIDYDEKKIVKEIHVKEGDIVKKGDLLVTYDSTLKTLDLEMKQLDKQMLELQVEKTKKDVEELKNQLNNPVSEISEEPVVPQIPERSEEQEEKETEEPKKPEKPELPLTPEKPEEIEKDLPAFEILTGDEVKNKEWIKGDGSIENPYVFLIQNNGVIKGDFFNLMMEQKAFFRIEVRENNQKDGAILQFWGQNGAFLTEVPAEDYFLLILSTKNLEQINTEEDFAKTAVSLPLKKQGQFRFVSEMNQQNLDSGAEIKQQIMNKEKELEGYQLDLKDLELDLKKTTEELGNMEIKSSFDGVVKKAGDPMHPAGNDEPLLLITGSKGFYVVGEVPETQLDLLKRGTILEGNSFENHVNFTAEVESVSLFPVEDMNGKSKESDSMYTFKAYVSQKDKLKDKENVSLSISKKSSEDMNGPVILEKPYVRFENGRNYVYKDDGKGRLKKQYITISRMIGGNAYEIAEGLSYEDCIAFPYGKWTVENAKTKKGSIEELDE